MFLCGVHVALLAVIWFTLAYTRASALLFTAGQTALFAAATLVGLDFTSRQEWWWTSTRVWIDPRVWQMLGCVWAVLCLGWTVLRTSVDRAASRLSSTDTTLRSRQLSLTHEFLNPAWPPIDHAAIVALMFSLVAVASYAAWPGVAQELSLESSVDALAQRSPELVTQIRANRLVPATIAFEAMGVPHEPAIGNASWMLLALAACVLVVGLWERANGWRVLGLLVVGAAACPLLAARCEPLVSVASALRWLSAGYFLIGSVAFWSRDHLAGWGTKLGVRELSASSGRLANSSVAALALLAAAPLVAMASLVSWGAFDQATIAAETRQLMAALGVLFAVATTVSAALTDRRPFEPTNGRSSSTQLARVGQFGQRDHSRVRSSATRRGVDLCRRGAPGRRSRRRSRSRFHFHPHGSGAELQPAGGAGGLGVGGLCDSRTVGNLRFRSWTGHQPDRHRRLSLHGGEQSDTPRSAALDRLGNAQRPGRRGVWAVLAWRDLVVDTRQRRARTDRARLQVAQAGLAVSLILLVLGAATAVLWNDPQSPELWLAAVSSPLGIAACVTTLSLSLLLSAGRSRIATTALAATSLWCIGTMLGTGAVRWDTGNWLAIHVLLSARIVGPWLMIAGGWWWYRRDVPAFDDPPRRAVTIWTSLLTIPLLLTSLRLVGTADLQEPWWSTIGVKSAALVASLLGHLVVSPRVSVCGQCAVGAGDGNLVSTQLLLAHRRRRRC